MQQSEQDPGHDIEVEVMDSDVSVGRMHVRSSITALQRELQNFSNVAERPTIIVNHIYNIHHPADRPSEQHMQDVEAHGRNYMSCIVRRCLENCENARHAYQSNLLPCLRVAAYFDGKTGLKRNCEYIPDSKYQKCVCRVSTYSDSCPPIDLKKLHEGSKHVALVGNLGSGKSTICRAYGDMVLNREVPELQDVEMVHYISLTDIQHCSERKPIRKLLFDDFVAAEFVDENTRKYGYEYLCRNPEKMLFIFDGADVLLSSFTTQVEVIRQESETNLQIVLQNILCGRLFHGCRTLMTTREWALKELISGFRPERIIIVEPLTEEQRASAINSWKIPKNLCDDINKTLRNFHAACYLTKDPLYLEFAKSSLLLASNGDGVRITTDVTLVIQMLHCLLRSKNFDPECSDYFSMFKKIAFSMIKKGSLRLLPRDLKRICEQYKTVKEVRDFMVVAPEHSQVVTHRLLESDFCCFFPNQVFQEVLAALHACDMSKEDFTKFVDEHLHTDKKWHVIRRFICGIEFHHDIKQHLLNNPCRNVDCHEEKLLSSLEKALIKMNSLQQQDRLELLGTLQECGEFAKPMLERHFRSLDLPDIALEPSDMYALSRVMCYAKSFDNVHVCLHRSVSVEAYSLFLMVYVKKTNVITLDLSNLDLEPAHIDGLEKPLLKDAASTCQKHDIHLIVKKTPPCLLAKFNHIKCHSSSIKISEVTAASKSVRE